MIKVFTKLSQAKAFAVKKQDAGFEVRVYSHPGYYKVLVK